MRKFSKLFEWSKREFIPVSDTSGSMCQKGNIHAFISLALWLFISERNKGPFKEAFITFLVYPKMQYLKGNINDRIVQLTLVDWGNYAYLVKIFDYSILKGDESKNLY